MLNNLKIRRQNEGQSNSVQLNIVTFIDLDKAVMHKSLENTYYMMDNSLGRLGQGTEQLQTVCHQGQILNWIIYTIDSDKRADGSWPPMAKINHIVFLDQEGGDLAGLRETKVCVEFKQYGMPDQVPSKSTPVYCYWAGMVLPSLKPGIYPYRFVIELEQEGKSESLFLHSSRNASLRVLGI